jgi:hypothetical protein
MDPFVLSRNAFKIYCSDYVNTNTSFHLTDDYNQSSIDMNNSSEYSQRKENNNNNLRHEEAIRTLNQRYEYFLQTLDQLRISFERTTKDYNINSISNSERETSTVSSVRTKRSNKSHLYKRSKRRMPKISITVSCAEHLTQQQPNIKMS